MASFSSKASTSLMRTSRSPFGTMHPRIAARAFRSPPRTASRPALARHQSTTAAPSGPPRFVAPVAAAAVLSLAAGYGLALAAPPTVAKVLNPPAAPPSPAADTPHGIEIMRNIEKALQELPLVRQLRQETEEAHIESDSLDNTKDNANLHPDGTPAPTLRKKWQESRPHLNWAPSKRVHSLTAGSLKGPGKIATPPLVFSTADNRESVIIVHAGRDLCGHDGIIHGGFLATLLDEGLARPALLSLPSNIGVTANLNINYRALTFADQFLVLRVKCTKAEGRKAICEGRVETLTGQLLADATGLFVEPKVAKYIANSSVKEQLGA